MMEEIGCAKHNRPFAPGRHPLAGGFSHFTPSRQGQVLHVTIGGARWTWNASSRSPGSGSRSLKSVPSAKGLLAARAQEIVSRAAAAGAGRETVPECVPRSPVRGTQAVKLGRLAEASRLSLSAMNDGGAWVSRE
jgi:hypothetical protein